MASLEKILDQVSAAPPMQMSNSMIFEDCCPAWDLKRIKGSHHVFVLRDKPVLINLQREGRKAKPYQVRQVRRIITEHGLTDNI